MRPMQTHITSLKRIINLVCIAALAMACAPATPAAEASTTLGNAIDCEAGEELVFAGDVEDDFGLSVTVCLKSGADPHEPTVTIIYSGEGGTRSVSCKSSECSGVIDFTHYVRPRFTILTLTWRDENGEQRLVETFDAQALDSNPVKSVSHSWAPPPMLGQTNQNQNEPPQIYQVVPQTQPLAMLRLDGILAR